LSALILLVWRLGEGRTCARPACCRDRLHRVVSSRRSVATPQSRHRLCERFVWTNPVQRARGRPGPDQVNNRTPIWYRVLWSVEPSEWASGDGVTALQLLYCH